jgi:UPF0042 nucleotide-binding protein
MRVLVVSGLAGAGKSTALRALEDLGFYCVDNQPVPLLSALVDLVASVGATDVAVSIDARQHEFLASFSDQTRLLREAGHQVEVLFLEAADEVLIRRFSQTRRRHPLAGDELTDGVARDRLALAALRDDAAVINTSELNVHQLKAISATVGAGEAWPSRCSRSATSTAFRPTRISSSTSASSPTRTSFPISP